MTGFETIFTTVMGILMNNLAFEVGFDHYRLDLHLEADRFEEADWEQVQFGFQAAKQQDVSKLRCNKFESKVLSIRSRCLKSGLEVTITAKDLMAELEITNGLCPITEEPFTFAQQNLTDWSIDRVDNTRGYVPDNIAIVSVKANKAKGDSDLPHMIEQAVRKYNPNSTLTQKQWFLMGRFYYERLTLTETLNMTAILYHSPEILFKVIVMQLYYPNTKHSHIFSSILAPYCPKLLIERTIKLILKRYKTGKVAPRSNHGLNLVLNSPKALDAIFILMMRVLEHYAEFDEILTVCFFKLPPDVLDVEHVGLLKS